MNYNPKQEEKHSHRVRNISKTLQMNQTRNERELAVELCLVFSPYPNFISLLFPFFFGLFFPLSKPLPLVWIPEVTLRCTSAPLGVLHVRLFSFFEFVRELMTAMDFGLRAWDCSPTFFDGQREDAVFILMVIVDFMV